MDIFNTNTYIFKIKTLFQANKDPRLWKNIRTIEVLISNFYYSYYNIQVLYNEM